MKSEYTSDELLPLSGIQHFVFCRWQWALIHVERQWQDNVLTVEGKLLHKRTDDPFFTETRKGVFTARSTPIASPPEAWIETPSHHKGTKSTKVASRFVYNSPLAATRTW